jgi:hypothetical protein
MMKITQTVHGGIEQNISNLVPTATWSGDYKQAARQLNFSVTNTPTDCCLPKVQIVAGSLIRLYDDNGIERYRGYVFCAERKRSELSIDATTYDGLTYVARNKATYNFKNMSPEAITAKLCADFGVPVSALAATGVPISQIYKGQALYDIIMKSYTIAAQQNGKKYMVTISKGALSVVEKGVVTSDYFASSETNLTDATYSESIESMVNRVKIYDKDGNYIDTVENSGDISSYGVLQDVYEQQSDKNAYTAARAMLKSIARDGKITGISGNWDCVAGNAIRIKEPFTGLTGLFYIDTDSHKFENGQHTMDLTLSFQNMMNSMEESS